MTKLVLALFLQERTPESLYTVAIRDAERHAALTLSGAYYFLPHGQGPGFNARLSAALAGPLNAYAGVHWAQTTRPEDPACATVVNYPDPPTTICSGSGTEQVQAAFGEAGILLEFELTRGLWAGFRAGLVVLESGVAEAAGAHLALGLSARLTIQAGWLLADLGRISAVSLGISVHF
jgi:hypothetical protein